MHLKAKVVNGVLWSFLAALGSVAVLVFAANSSFDGVLNMLQQVQLVGLIAIAMLLFVLVGGSILARQLSHPISVLAAFVDSMSRGRTVEPIPYLDQKDAVGDLARAIDSLAKRSKEELSRSVESTQSVKRELMSSNYRLQEVNKHVAQYKEAIKDSEDMMAELETHDESTGLHNRRYFDSVFEYEAKRMQRTGRAFSVAVFEVMCWRDIKAGLGLPAADTVLKQMAETVMSAVRSTDFVARYSDSAVAVLLPETEAVHATRLVDNIYVLIEATTWQLPLKSFDVVIGAGVVATDAIAVGDESVLQRMEAALEKSIAAGGGRVEVA